MTQNIQDFINARKGVRPNSAIIERWQNRIVAQGMVDKGRAGALEYLQKYGKSIGAPKVTMLARQAEIEGRPEIAAVFWEKAYQLVSGNHQSLQELDHVTRSRELEKFEIPAFPSQFQPGRLAPMQPQDAKHSRDYYVNNPAYWGQPKRDGEKLIIFSAMYKEAYQARSMALREAPSQEFEYALCCVAGTEGPFILEGEIYYIGVDGKEYQSQATCATINTELGQGEVQPVLQFSAFSCLFLNNPIPTQAERVNVGEKIMDKLAGYAPGIFVKMPTARTADEKLALIQQQEAEGREGEVWFDQTIKYSAGKNNLDVFVRTKYLTEPTEYIITDVSPAAAEGHYIGGFSVQTLDGEDKGTVGTGYTREQQIEILQHFATDKPCKVLVVSQGFTPFGKLKFGRFAGWPESAVELKTPATDMDWIDQ